MVGSRRASPVAVLLACAVFSVACEGAMAPFDDGGVAAVEEVSPSKGDTVDAQGADSATDAGAAAADGGPSSSACTALSSGVTGATRASMVAQVLSAIKTATGEDAIETGSLAYRFTVSRFGSVTLNAPDGDGAIAALKYLVSIGAALAPANELSFTSKSLSTLSMAGYAARTSVAGRAPPLTAPALTLLVQRTSVTSPWYINQVTYYVPTLALDAVTADRMIACAPATPRADGIYAKGLDNVLSCSGGASVKYTPLANDTLVWDPAGPSWSAESVWALRQTANLTINPTNYWSNISDYACYCPQSGNVPASVGYKYVVDVITGAVFQVTAGLTCVHC
jgi:hypothetical protein